MSIKPEDTELEMDPRTTHFPRLPVCVPLQFTKGWIAEGNWNTEATSLLKISSAFIPQARDKIANPSSKQHVLGSYR